mmetsp:Transcript_4565/g.20737  ORF Transcript_4565/g.20737 Transcript_4565/m.20737 type:complete len:354 (-) Transcript_4565:392-1453(-)
MYGDRCRAAHAQAAAAERRRRGVQSALAERNQVDSSDGTKSRRIPEESGDDRDDKNLALAAGPVNYGCAAAFVALALPLCASIANLDPVRVALVAAAESRGLATSLARHHSELGASPKARGDARELLLALARNDRPHGTVAEDACEVIEARTSAMFGSGGGAGFGAEALEALADDCRLLAGLARSAHDDDDDDDARPVRRVRRPRREVRRARRGEGRARVGGGEIGCARSGVPSEDAPRPARPRRRRVRRPGRAAPPRALRVVFPSRRGADPRVFPVRRSRQTRVARRGRLRQVDAVDGGQDDEGRAAVLVHDSRRGRRRRGGRARRQVAVRFDLEGGRGDVRESRGFGVPDC